ncbi:MAG: glycoside hydrolase family 2 TIM barrel-domain containing protein [Proteiniphilum sp.]|uniref:glycoside hydrolase family 2 TIM barrel-domain containing protein n=1 Tax=Proteiniphilum sp. TaxID=1926877 RepID=UPI002B212E02|nr:glycoside hydrolase family 2 TIM barrel-domain containing protein [Proteiniphilum sp.]MEA5127461.1 glycoside hydrolase family 2 TIM barrel-domain containing protein [Proteiniphilum sp.]
MTTAVQQGYAFERKIPFNDSWKFHRGSVANAEQPSYSDAKWRVLDLPHDWSVEPSPVQKEGLTIGPFSKLNEGGADIGQTLGGEGWYRKEFTILEKDTEKQFTLYFEGVYNQSEVFVNGRKVYFNPYGYTSYKVDITDYCNLPGIKNIVAVRVVNAGQNSRWYAGSGIYRHVWLIKTEKTYLDEWDTFVNASELNGKNAPVKFSTIVHHLNNQNQLGELKLRIISPRGKEVYSTSEKLILSDKIPFSTVFTVKNPELWSVETPVLYTAEVSIISGEKEMDRIQIPFGIRTISLSAKEGFLLNGKSMKLKGGCIHHDNGLLGAVVIDRAEERKVELLKANGYNAVRCAHNQVSEYFLESCDRLGLLVIHETFDQWQRPKRENDYSQFFDEWSDSDLAASVRRDRNHPSIIMWSIGNEVEQRADQPEGDLISKRLVNTVLKYDDSRYTTIGANDFWDRRNFSWDKDAYRAFQNVDVAGYNYVWKKYESDHMAYPDRIIYGSESYPKEAAQNWSLVEKHPYIIGDFVWTAIDYIGEAGLAHALELVDGESDPQFMGWPWYNAWCGDIDFCGDKKPQSYYRDILWKEREISMAVHPPVTSGKREVVNGWGWPNELLSWNWKGWEGQTMIVNVYSRSPKVRLYKDNTLVAEKDVNPENYTASFEVIYTPGELRAVNIVRNKETASTTLKTTGIPSAIRLVADRGKIEANKNDLSFVKIEIVDNGGDVVPDATIPLKIECNGKGQVVASGNGGYDDMKSFRSLTPDTFRGKAIAIVQPAGEKGTIELSVSSEGLQKATLLIEVY